jgi:hypothetical protein
MTGQRLRQPDGDFCDRIRHSNIFIGNQVVEEHPDCLQMTGDGFWGKAPRHQMIDILSDLPAGHLLDGGDEPGGKVRQFIHVAFYRMGREVSSL